MNVHIEHEIGNLHCPACHTDMPLASHAFYERDHEKPSPGDVTMCIKCGELAVFDDCMQLREPTVDEHIMFGKDKRIDRLRRAWLATQPEAVAKHEAMAPEAVRRVRKYLIEIVGDRQPTREDCREAVSRSFEELDSLYPESAGKLTPELRAMMIKHAGTGIYEAIRDSIEARIFFSAIPPSEGQLTQQEEEEQSDAL